ncbi:hypothetical protein ACIQ2D_17780 [Lysinibacillus sp. NPDC097287]|uniref:hypothetical protein n=1 Tax=Lysinibacillus sp. NPDC097287 TaxID=3364144 RepID=UPI0037FC7999
MNDKQFDKRMELLKKSYDRLESQLTPEDIFAQIEAEEKENKSEPMPPPKQPSKWQKPAVWAASIASVLLIGVLAAPYMLKESENVQSEVSQELNSTTVEYDEWIENITKKYERQREQVRRELLVSADELASLSFIKRADETLEHYQTSKRGPRDALYLASIEENILNYLMTPKRAIELIKTYNRLSFDESYHIYTLYEQSVEELEIFYSNLLEPYVPLLLKSTDASQFPSDLQAIMEAANKQFLELQIDGEDVRFKANPIDGEFAPDYINKLHPDIFGYFEYSKRGYLLLVDDLRYSREETVKSLKILERTLLADANSESGNYKVLKETYENTWMAIFKGTESYPSKTKTGEYNAQYVQFLQEVANGKYGEAMEGVATTIVEEIHRDGHSETLVRLTAYDIWMELLQTREETVGYIDDSDFSIMDMGESQKEQIQAVYKQYTKSYDEAIINQLHPMNIAALYLYASIIGDERVMQSLSMKDTKINTNTLQQIKSLDVFSEIGIYEGIQPIVVVRFTEGYQDLYGRQLIIKVSLSEGGYYRITEIND